MPSLNDRGDRVPLTSEPATPADGSSSALICRESRLFNLYLDPKENKSYLTRKLTYLEVLREGMRGHLATFRAHPPKRVMGLGAGRARPPA